VREQWIFFPIKRHFLTIAEKRGVVKEFTDLPDARFGAVRVEWEGGTKNRKSDGDEPELPLYRLGADGVVEVKLADPDSPENVAGNVYIDHLPSLGALPRFSFSCIISMGKTITLGFI